MINLTYMAGVLVMKAGYSASELPAQAFEILNWVNIRHYTYDPSLPPYDWPTQSPHEPEAFELVHFAAAMGVAGHLKEVHTEFRAQVTKENLQRKQAAKAEGREVTQETTSQPEQRKKSKRSSRKKKQPAVHVHRTPPGPEEHARTPATITLEKGSIQTLRKKRKGMDQEEELGLPGSDSGPASSPMKKMKVPQTLTEKEQQEGWQTVQSRSTRQSAKKAAAMEVECLGAKPNISPIVVSSGTSDSDVFITGMESPAKSTTRSVRSSDSSAPDTSQQPAASAQTAQPATPPPVILPPPDPDTGLIVIAPGPDVPPHRTIDPQTNRKYWHTSYAGKPDQRYLWDYIIVDVSAVPVDRPQMARH